MTPELHVASTPDDVAKYLVDCLQQQFAQASSAGGAMASIGATCTATLIAPNRVSALTTSNLGKLASNQTIYEILPDAGGGSLIRLEVTRPDGSRLPLVQRVAANVTLKASASLLQNAIDAYISERKAQEVQESTPGSGRGLLGRIQRALGTSDQVS